MSVPMTILIAVLTLIAVVIFGFIIYFMCSPMPVVRLLRRKMDGEITMPENSREAVDSVEVHRNLIYNSRYKQNDYDLFLPKEAGRYPLVLWVHGGAFVAGDKSGIENWGIMLASKGYAVASINYCWAPEAAYPAQIIQVAEAISAVEKSNLSEKIDMSRVALAGDSAGAYIAAQFAAAHSNSLLAEKIGVNSPLKSDSLKCALLYCGPYDVKRMLTIENKMLRLFISRIGWSLLGQKNWQKAPLISTVTPMDFVTENFTPCYITDGNTGSFENHGRALAEKLKENGVQVKERYFSKEQYGEVFHEYQMQLDTENGINCFNDTIEFLSENMKKENC